ncbi:MAG: 50S ribosomal protein L21 [Clostridiales bacterium]|nr:50S ribosomal protein L21 [Clostridiales bacterium]
MFVIVEIQGQQFKAEAGKFLYVHYLGDEKKEGDVVEFDKVLLVDADGAVKVGAPTVEGAKVVCEVKKSLVKGDKVIVFKKKRRKGYRRKNGHRQCFTQVVIKDVVA